MSFKIDNAEIKVKIERLNSDIIDEHLRNSTVILQGILNSDNIQSSEINEYSCQRCRKIYKTEHSLVIHIAQAHSEDEKGMQCKKCNKTYPSVLSFRNHMRYMHRYDHRCKVCYRTFATVDMLRSHGESCNKSDTPCPQCGKIYNSWLAIKNHLKYKHPEVRDYWCGICRRTFSNNQRLMKHNKSTHPVGETDCSTCDKSFSSRMALQSHILHKHMNTAVRCHQCYKVFAKKINLEKHLAKQHFFKCFDSNYRQENNS